MKAIGVRITFSDTVGNAGVSIGGAGGRQHHSPWT